jgi:TM2 domain-containing membrane protein YozV
VLTLLWIIAVVLVIAGIVQIVRGQLVVGLILIVVGLLIGPGGVSIYGAIPAGAQAATPAPAPAAPFLTLNNTLVSLAVGIVLPLVNALLLRPSNPRWAKVLVASIVGAAATALSQAIQPDGTAILSKEWLLGLAITVGSMIVAYLGVWQPLANPNRNLPTVAPVGDVVELAVSPKAREARAARKAA